MKKILLLCCCLLFSKLFGEQVLNIIPNGYFLGKYSITISYRPLFNPHTKKYTNSKVSSIDIKKVTPYFHSFQIEGSEGTPFFPIYINKEKEGNYFFSGNSGEKIQSYLRWLSLGSYYNSMKEIAIYQDEEYLGSIQGRWQYENEAEYVFYNENDNPIAIACLKKKEDSEILITDFDQEGEIVKLNKIHKNYPNGSVNYSWQLTIKKEEVIPPNLLLIFASFITDSYYYLHTP